MKTQRQSFISYIADLISSVEFEESISLNSYIPPFIRLRVVSLRKYYMIPENNQGLQEKNVDCIPLNSNSSILCLISMGKKKNKNVTDIV